MNEKQANDAIGENKNVDRSEIGETGSDLNVRLTALVLGEASDFERSQLEVLMNERPELRAQFNQIKRLHDALAVMDLSESADAEQNTGAEWKLSDARRSTLLAVLDSQQPNPIQRHLADHTSLSAPAPWYHKRSTWWSIGITTAASLLVCIGLMLPAMNAARTVSMRYEGRVTDGAAAYDLNDASPSPLDGSESDQREFSMQFSNETTATPAPSAEVAAGDDFYARQKRAIDQPLPTNDRASGVAREWEEQVEEKLLEQQVDSNALSYRGRARGEQFGTADEKPGAKANEPAPADPTNRWYDANGVDSPNATPPTNPSYATPSTTTSLGVENNLSSPIVENFDVIVPQEPSGTGYPAFAGRLLEGRAVDAPAKPQSMTVEERFGAAPTDTATGNGPVPAAPTTASQTPEVIFADRESALGLQKSSGTDGLAVAAPRATVLLSDGLRDSEVDSKADTSNGRGDTLGIELKAAIPQQLAEGKALESKELRDRRDSAGKDIDSLADYVLEKDKAYLQSDGGLKSEASEYAAFDAEKKYVADGHWNLKGIKERPVDAEPARKRKQLQQLDELVATQDPFSTFSLHVSDVSFKLAAAALAAGQLPDASKIRVEEFVNAFDYLDPLPTSDERVACQIEQAIHPFMMQRNVMRISLRTAATGRPENLPLRLTLLLDNSGSMERADRRQTVRKAFEALAAQVKPNDQVTLISFANRPRLVAERFSGSQVGELVQLVQNLPSEGGTNLEAALKLAMEKASEGITPENAAGLQNRIVLMTDGAVNLGDANPASLSQLVLEMRDKGIAFDTAGISAQELNDEVLEALTRQGDGRYYLLDTAEEANSGFAEQIAGALRPSAKNVKVQVEFNPDRVGRYKLLGFEKHLLKQEDFRNDKVDAAEMAAAEAGVAIYQFEPMPDGRGDIGSVSVRFQDLATGTIIERRWPIPYDASAARFEQGSPGVRLATTAAMFASKLRGDALGDAVELKSLADTLTTLPPNFSAAPRVRQLQTMINAARQIGEP